MWNYLKEEILIPIVKLAPYISGGWCAYTFLYPDESLDLSNIPKFLILWPLVYIVLAGPILGIIALGEFSFNEIEKAPIWVKYQLHDTKKGFLLKIFIFVLGAFLVPLFILLLFELTSILIVPFAWFIGL